jgi:hypothetical protein
MLPLGAAAAGLIYGLLHEIWDTSTALDYTVAGAFLVVIAILAAVPSRSTGPAPALAIPMVTAGWVAGVVGEFLAFLFGLEGRTIHEYSSDSTWWLLLAVSLVFLFVVSVLAGLISALLSWGLSTLFRCLRPG